MVDSGMPMFFDILHSMGMIKRHHAASGVSRDEYILVRPLESAASNEERQDQYNNPKQEQSRQPL